MNLADAALISSVRYRSAAFKGSTVSYQITLYQGYGVAST
jgi:hypothetical protein